MATRRVDNQNPKATRRPPAKTPQDREDQLIAMAMDAVEAKIIAGTASSQELVHFLRLGSSSEKIAQRYKTEEIKLLEIKRESIASQKRTEELMSEALHAFKAYSTGVPHIEEDDRNA